MPTASRSITRCPKAGKPATTDGERWRWALAQAVENSPNRLNAVRLQMAQFFEQPVRRADDGSGRQGRGRGFSFGPQGDDDTKKDESGTYALHTLKEDETIARLATGIKRFTLPDEFNYIKIYQQIIAEPKTGMAEDALRSSWPRSSRIAGSIPAAAKIWQAEHRQVRPRPEQLEASSGSIRSSATGAVRADQHAAGRPGGDGRVPLPQRQEGQVRRPRGQGSTSCSTT